MILLMKWFMLLFYISFGRHHHELLLMRKNESIIMKICLCLKIQHVPVIYWTSKGKVIDQLLLCICLSILNFVVVVCGANPKSCSRSYMHFGVPWILDGFSNDPCTGTTNDCDCCLHWLSSHVGKCSIARPWFSQGLVGWGSLPSHL